MSVIVVPERAIGRGVEGVESELPGGPALLLTRAPDRFPECIDAVSAARALEMPWIPLPADVGLARWVVRTAVEWASRVEPSLERALLGLVSLLPAQRGMPTTTIPGSEALAPAMPSRMLARYARIVFVPCRACGGGGASTRACARCGRLLPEAT